jgi:hypothetical protein
MTPYPAPHIVRWFLRATGYGGVTLPPLGIFILAEHLHSQRLIRHEQAHWAQYQHLGWWRFVLAYLTGLIRHGYWNHPMEIEARRAEA